MKKPAVKNVAVKVPRFGTVAPLPEVIEAARKLALKEGIIFKPDETIDPHSAEGEGIEQASEWNSMLITARAGRGPQWDVSSQIFQVDQQSHIFYDHGVLATTEPDPDAPESAMQSQGQTPSGSGFTSPPPSFRRTPSQGGEYLTNGGYHTGPATPSPAPTRSDMPPPSSERRRVTRGSSGRDSMY